MAGAANHAIVPFEARHADAFRDLNLAWIEHYFGVEAKDREVLDNPGSNIIDKGGAILVAEDGDGTAVGCVGLVPVGDGVLELVKMAVADSSRRTGIGGMLVSSAIAEARRIGAKSLYLESNSRLEAALRLYERAGFRHLPAEEQPASPYARCNVYMRLEL